LGPPDPDEALADMRRVLELFGETKAIHEYVVRIWAFEATEQWEQVIRESLAGHAAELKWNIWPGGVYPHLGRACVNLGEDYLTSGQFDKALEAYDESMRINIKATIASVLVVGPDIRDPQIALPYAVAAVKAKPDWPYFHETLGIVYYRLGQYEKAIESLEKVIELHWDENPAWESFFMAMAQWQLGNKEEARNLYYQGVEEKARANLDDYHTKLLLPYQYEAATLLGIPGAPTPNPDLVYREEDE
jgi:tetratricopeptide (TPR) repeat protein